MILKKKGYILLLTTWMFTIMLAACGSTQSETGGNDLKTIENYPTSIEENPIVTVTMENGDEMKIELYPKVAPNTVANFISLIEKGFYNGVIFHRVIPGFMIQGGDPNGNGTGGPDYSIKGEFSSNGFENNLKHDRGVLSMARTMVPDSAGSQFFIMVKNSPHLDGQYAAFGKVIEGMEVADNIVAAKRDMSDKPYEDQKMKTVTVDTKGLDYPDPEVIK
ncbi:peptidylprolyl isomerase [Bacillus carboniphilus]|uniref:Peptidyl-prolyl cis-trans isomerase n=1 Tax=Bacillus carboniphilus TaxID=86663 RepID=A0ABN0WNH5_9BACI